MVLVAQEILPGCLGDAIGSLSFRVNGRARCIAAIADVSAGPRKSPQRMEIHAITLVARSIRVGDHIAITGPSLDITATSQPHPFAQHQAETSTGLSGVVFGEILLGAALLA